MYKTRIKAWGLTKYNKNANPAYRPPRGNLTRAPLSTDDTIVTAQLRTNEQYASGLELVSVRGASGIRAVAHTPFFDANRIPIRTSTLQDISDTERLLFLVRDSMKFSVDHLLSASLQNHHCPTSVYRPPSESLLDYIVLSVLTMQSADYQKAGMYWQKAFSTFDEAIGGEQCYFVPVIVSCLNLLFQYGVEDVASALQRHLFAIACVKLQAQHPYRLFLEILARTPMSTMNWLSLSITDIFEQGLSIDLNLLENGCGADISDWCEPQIHSFSYMPASVDQEHMGVKVIATQLRSHGPHAPLQNFEPRYDHSRLNVQSLTTTVASTYKEYNVREACIDDFT